MGRYQSRMNSPSFTLRFQEGKDILLAHGTLHVPDDGTGLVVDELNPDLGNTTTGSGTSDHLS